MNSPRQSPMQLAAARIASIVTGVAFTRRTGWAALVVGLLVLGWGAMFHWATGADVAFGFANPNLIQLTEEQIVSNVFRNQQSVPAARQCAENALQLQVDFVALIGTLSDQQRGKLELAGEGDICGFFNEFDSFLRTAPIGNITQEQWQEFWQKLSPLQTRYTAGLHGQKSLFRKTIPAALSAEQLTVFEQLERERQHKHYRALVEATLALIDGKIPLTAKQRGAIMDLVMHKTQPPRAYGQSYYQYHYVLYQMSQIQDDLKPLFLENEWPVMQGVLQQGRFMEQMLKQMEGADAN